MIKFKDIESVKKHIEMLMKVEIDFIKKEENKHPSHWNLWALEKSAGRISAYKGLLQHF